MNTNESIMSRRRVTSTKKNPKFQKIAVIILHSKLLKKGQMRDFKYDCANDPVTARRNTRSPKREKHDASTAVW
jgi:hypothetical protein